MRVWPFAKRRKAPRITVEESFLRQPPGAILFYAGSLSDEALERLKRAWEARHTGDRRATL